MYSEAETKEIAQTWLSEFSKAFASGDAHLVAQTFLPDGWLRDVLTFTWDIRAFEGREPITRYLSTTLLPTKVSNITLDQTPHLGPVTENFFPQEGLGIAFGFTYETAVAQGKGYARLLREKVHHANGVHVTNGVNGTESVDGDGKAKWKAFAVCMIASELKGYEEAGYESGIYEGHTAAWEDVLADRKAKNENDPYVLVGTCSMFLPLRFVERSDRMLIYLE